MQISAEEFEAIRKLMDFVDRPVDYDCSINIGDADTYDERVGWLFEDAQEAIAAVQARAMQPANDG